MNGVAGRRPLAPRSVQRFVAPYSRPSLTWDDLPALRKLTRLPIPLKGVLAAADVFKALALGPA